MEKITITKALTKLKTLGSKIHKATNRTFVTYKVGDKIESTEDTVANYQSVIDLINFRDNLKAKIADSNARTKVQISGKTYTVVEAIEKKNSIMFKQSLLTKLRTNLAETRDNVDYINEDVQKRLDKLIEASVGNDKNKVEIDAIAKPFLKRNEAQIVDELKIEDKINNLDKEITEFLEEVDVALSESNAITYIEV